MSADNERRTVTSDAVLSLRMRTTGSRQNTLFVFDTNIGVVQGRVSLFWTAAIISRLSFQTMCNF